MVSDIRTIYQIARADLLERIRQYSFLVIMGITLVAAYFFVPPVDAGYVTLYLEEYRGIYNSAWVGSSVALSATLFLSLLGFYLVKFSIQRDERTGVGQIIAATSVKKLHYLIGKALSNFAVLSCIVAIVMVMAVIMQLVRGEVTRIELWPLLSPFLFLTLPVMSVVAAAAVLFETRQVLQNAPGNIIYFFLFIGFTMASSFLPVGTTVVTSDMVQKLAALKPDFEGSYGIGILIPEEPIRIFEWQGVQWSGALIGKQLLLFPAAFLLILLAAVLFKDFQESPARGLIALPHKAPAEAPLLEVEQDEPSREPPPQIRAANLTAVTAGSSALPLIGAEWRLMMKAAPRGWYAVALLLLILCVALPSHISSQWMVWPLVWIWPLVLWSGMGSRESRYQTQFLIFSSPRSVTRQLTAVWMAGVLLTFLTGSGMLVRLIIESNTEQLVQWFAAALLIPSFALASGVLTQSNRTFEVLYMILWYLGPFNKMPVLNFMGTTSTAGSAWNVSFLYLLISIGLLILAYTYRSRLTKAW